MFSSDVCFPWETVFPPSVQALLPRDGDYCFKTKQPVPTANAEF